uniref:Uncharacterized protein n=1 Tax=Arundo donax TaxID=35708 RepID=A0A0A9G795_ARUDO
MTIIIGLLCVTAPKNCTTFGCRISCSTSSSSLNARTLSSSIIRSSSSFLTATGMPLHVAFIYVPLDILLALVKSSSFGSISYSGTSRTLFTCIGAILSLEPCFSKILITS